MEKKRILSYDEVNKIDIRRLNPLTVTIYDVAREANVSMATVSRVVNGNQNVKPATRKKF